MALNPKLVDRGCAWCGGPVEQPMHGHRVYCSHKCGLKMNKVRYANTLLEQQVEDMARGVEAWKEVQDANA